MVVPPKVLALSETFTDNSHNPDDVNLRPIVSWGDGVNVRLNARNAEIKVFTQDTSGLQLIRVVDACSNYYGNVGRNGVRLNDVRNTDIRVTVPGFGSKTNTERSDCDGRNIEFRIPIDAFGTSDAYGNWKFKTVRITKIGGVGIKAFQVESNASNRVSFDDGEGFWWRDAGRPLYEDGSEIDAFAVWNSDDALAARNPHAENRYRFHFTPRECFYDRTNVYLKWYDADARDTAQSSNEIGGIGWRLVDLGTWPYNDNRVLFNVNDPDRLGDNGSLSDPEVSFKQFNVGVLDYDHRYRWEWYGVDTINGVQLWLPFSEVSNALPDGDAACPRDVRASCTATPSTETPAVGTNVTVTLRITNTGTSTWPDSVTITGSTPHGIGNLPPGQSRTYTDTYTRNTQGRATYTYRIRDGSRTLATCSANVTWQPRIVISVSCGRTTISNPTRMGYHFIWHDSGGGVVWDSRSLGGPSTEDQDWNTFQTFTMLRPHNSYIFRVYEWNTSNVIVEAPLDLCMTASCAGSINTTFIAEPGDRIPATFGVSITNDTGQTFTNEYNAYATTTGGLSIVGGTNPDYDPAFAAGPNATTALSGPWEIQTDHTGTMTVVLRHGGTNILGVSCTSSYTPETRPFISVDSGDIKAGGGFRYLQSNGTRQCTASRYFSPATAGGNETVGGIRTFGRPLTYGSRAEFAAYALGLIDGTGGAGGNAGNFGFYSDRNNGSFNGLTFANTGISGGNLGGLLGGNSTAGHCAPDYFYETANKTNPTFQTRGVVQLNSDADINGGTGGQHFFKAPGGQPCLRIRGELGSGKRVTIYTNDDVCIDGPITYGNWTFNLGSYSNDAPYLTVITKGNIYVDHGVTRITGLFIAQPNDDGTGGEFSTCSIGAALANHIQVRNDCKSVLTVSGAVIAQRLHLLRSQHSLIDGPNQATEIFNFTPSTVMGQPNFASEGGTALPNKLEGLYSLPPVF